MFVRSFSNHVILLFPRSIMISQTTNVKVRVYRDWASPIGSFPRRAFRVVGFFRVHRRQVSKALVVACVAKPTRSNTVERNGGSNKGLGLGLAAGLGALGLGLLSA